MKDCSVTLPLSLQTGLSVALRVDFILTCAVVDDHHFARMPQVADWLILKPVK